MKIALAIHSGRFIFRLPQAIQKNQKKTEKHFCCSEQQHDS